MPQRSDLDGRPTILVVDDERELADLYATSLSDDYNVQTAYDGDEALRKAHYGVDVVLLDRRMPGLTGDEVLEELRASNVDCRVVLVTAVDPDLDVIELPFDDYLCKPVAKSRLRETVDRMIDRTAYDDTLREALAVAAKMATLESQLEMAELDASGEYAALTARFEELCDEIDTVPGEGDDLYSELFALKLERVFDAAN